MQQDEPIRLVSALARGVAVIQCFSPSKLELSGRELVELTGLPKPTLFRLLDTLCELSLLRYSERVSKYVAGIGLLNLAAPALARMTVRQLARPLMQELADHCGGQIQLAVGQGENLSFVALLQGAGSPVFRPELGTRVSLPRSASGRAYLLTLSVAEREAYLAGLEARDPARKAWLLERLEDARSDLAEHGFCRGHRDLHREIDGIAVPMRVRKDGEIWVFSASVPVFSQQSKDLTEDLGPRLVTLARNVEASMGGVE
jgi:DNA-binding IclR family transcriptional regulator